MTNETQWKTKFEQEIQHGLQARQNGKEGMARVCARRAAGVVIGEYFHRRRLDQADGSAYDLLRRLGSITGVPAEAVQIANLLLLRVTPEYHLPVDTDLLAQAQQLAQVLLET